jgi:hypothetical protein
MPSRFASLCIAAAAAGLLAHAGARAAAPAASLSQPASPGAPVAQSSSPAQPGTPQRSKMKTCNADAKSKSLHGDERRAFMKQCLSGKSAPLHS